MMDKLNALLSIKSLVTLLTTVIFGVLALSGKLTAQEFLTFTPWWSASISEHSLKRTEGKRHENLSRCRSQRRL